MQTIRRWPDALVNDIAFVNTRTPVKEFSPDAALSGALAAAKRLGKPGSTAALRGLHRLDLEGPAAEGDTLYRVKLLANVIRTIEGDDVADFIFKRERRRRRIRSGRLCLNIC